MNQEMAETVALQALGWLAGNDELLPVFMGATGVSRDDLLTRAGNPDVLAAVLGFVTMDDSFVVAFCDNAGLDYTQPLMALQALPGGGEVHWT